jgi:hypothetical protein
LSKENIVVNVVLVLIAFSLISCSGTAETIPNENIPAENINTYIKLYDAPELMNSHKNGDLLTLQIINLSKSIIVFPENYHAKIFKKESGKWLEVQNNAHNSGDKFFLPTKDSYPLGDLVDFSPVTIASSPIVIRVSIDGYIEDNKEVRVGAYLDIEVIP